LITQSCFGTSTACIVSYAALKIIILALQNTNLRVVSLQETGTNMIMHYFPLNLMDRQLFLHHNMLSLYMAILTMSVLFGLMTCFLGSRVRWALVITISVAVMYVYRFISITYAEPWITTKCLSTTWRPYWDFSYKR
jgi:dolichyl-phosphate-mannose-protein mannosyltransferase